jgi:hypothetical protein
MLCHCERSVAISCPCHCEERSDVAISYENFISTRLLLRDTHRNDIMRIFYWMVRKIDYEALENI